MTANTTIEQPTQPLPNEELPYLDIIKDSSSLHQHYQKVRLLTPLSTYTLLVESGLITAQQLILHSMLRCLKFLSVIESAL